MAERIRLEVPEGKLGPVVATFDVGPGAIAYREVPATSPEASTAVEFFGGWVAVAATLQSTGDPAGLATERCVGSHRTWFLPDGSTGPDRTSTVVVMNPFDADAAVDATFRTEQRELTPEALTPLVVPAHASVAVSVGDYVLSGGEPAALALLDACVRLLPGVMGAPSSGEEESFESGLLEYPHYTRPVIWEGRRIPEVLRSGDHAKIAAWRKAKAAEETRLRRPDLIERHGGASQAPPSGAQRRDTKADKK
jgi:hypothetical protein